MLCVRAVDSHYVPVLGKVTEASKPLRRNVRLVNKYYFLLLPMMTEAGMSFLV